MKLRNKKQENRIREFNKAFSFSSFFIFWKQNTRIFLGLSSYTHLYTYSSCLKRKKSFNKTSLKQTLRKNIFWTLFRLQSVIDYLLERVLCI